VKYRHYLQLAINKEIQTLIILTQDTTDFTLNFFLNSFSIGLSLPSTIIIWFGSKDCNSILGNSIDKKSNLFLFGII